MNRMLKLLIALIATSVIAVGVAAAASSPSVSTNSARSITSDSAELQGSVDPNGASTAYQFEWGPSTNLYVATSPGKSAGRGTVAKAFSFKLGGLEPGTTYHYRLTATNRFGSAAGADRTFKTAGHPPPEAVTGGVSQLSANSATLTGYINPHGENTTFYFQYGPTTALGMQTTPSTVPAGNAAVPVAQSLSGLAAFTTFYFRLVALHGSSIAGIGLDQSFLTYPLPRPIPRLPTTTTPHRRRNAPYVFTTSGRVIGPSNIPQSVACGQNVVVRFFLGRREVGFTLASVQPNCTFAGVTIFPRLPGRGSRNRIVHLRVLIHFRGNGYLAPVNAKPESITLGRG